MAYEQILFELDGGVATITLNRPDHMNTWTATMSAELAIDVIIQDAPTD